MPASNSEARKRRPGRSSRTLATEIVGVPMPEGVYKARVELRETTWKRPRWPWPHKDRSYHLTVLSRPTPDGPRIEHDEHGNQKPGYIPVPGKGESSWDCGPDGIFSQIGPGRTVEDAVRSVRESALRKRRDRGYSDDYSEPIW